jgi:hypothetical protein
MAEPSTSTDSLSIAVREGVISQAQADAILAIKARSEGGDEPFTLVNNFGDLFLCLGLLIVYMSMSRFAGMLGLDPIAVYLMFAALFWVLAEVFVFKARRKFPAVISVLLFIWLGVQAYMAIALNSFSWTAIFAGRGEIGLLGVLTALFVVTMIRFRLPILVFGLAVSAVGLIFTYAMRHVEPLAAFSVLALCGAALIAAGIYLDSRDRNRTGQEHEWALWLFVVGSPLMVHGVMLYVLKDHLAMFALGASSGNPDLLIAQLGTVVWVISGLALAFTVVGLILDRRSLVASSLLYFTAVLTYAAYQSGAGLTVIVAAVPLAIGLLVIVLGLAWNPLRNLVLRVVPFGRWFRPPSEV